MDKLIEYIKIHLISLQQDLEVEESEYDVTYLEGCIHTCEHLLSVAEEIL